MTCKTCDGHGCSACGNADKGSLHQPESLAEAVLDTLREAETPVNVVQLKPRATPDRTVFLAHGPMHPNAQVLSLPVGPKPADTHEMSLRCRNCHNRTYMVAYRLEKSPFPELVCTGCGQVAGHFGWISDGDADEPE